MKTKVRGTETKIYKDMTCNIGKRLLAARKEKGLTLAQLAKASGLSVSFLSEIENGKVLPSIIVYALLCRQLEISAEIPLPEEE